METKMGTELKAKKEGEVYNIFAVRSGETVKIGSVTHGLKSVLDYRGTRHYVNFHLHHKLKDVLSSIRFFVDTTDTMKSVEAFQDKVRKSA
jgi:hypothetical protein